MATTEVPYVRGRQIALKICIFSFMLTIILAMLTMMRYLSIDVKLKLHVNIRIGYLTIASGIGAAITLASLITFLIYSYLLWQSRYVWISRYFEERGLIVNFDKKKNRIYVPFYHGGLPTVVHMVNQDYLVAERRYDRETKEWERRWQIIDADGNVRRRPGAPRKPQRPQYLDYRPAYASDIDVYSGRIYHPLNIDNTDTMRYDLYLDSHVTEADVLGSTTFKRLWPIEITTDNRAVYNLSELVFNRFHLEQIPLEVNNIVMDQCVPRIKNPGDHLLSLEQLRIFLSGVRALQIHPGFINDTCILTFLNYLRRNGIDRNISGHDLKVFLGQSLDC